MTTIGADGPVTSDSDTGLHALATFLENSEPLRQALSTRRLKGERLGPEEAAALELLNAHLDEILPKPAPDSPEVSHAMREAARLLAQYEHG